MEWFLIDETRPSEEGWIILTDTNTFWAENIASPEHLEAILKTRKPTHWATLRFPDEQSKSKSIFSRVNNEFLFKYRSGW
ncbi:hypothetical protein Mmc1_1961 [Magnetococcus marinus MC-1]|uniref:Uncharacterized protein n=1 Tax=Magnetococcus marinus (strain ATCC BAA-1437 / JCM 17883 / MC-1) TaxID=156889 RepID=A0L926_MAGMM|nr:hypothetical protein [Magnetococcus marinus]ABK44469.1 hypothetical protein Mmc1_1961 [Magnetococcus marinus MC-1]